MRVLILGGTGDASQLAIKASTLPGIEVIVSLAGRTSEPALIATRTRIGGFGGTSGLVAYLQNNAIDLLIDATHPYAAQISFNAATAAQLCGIPHLILVRPAWRSTKGDRWIEVDNIKAAAAILSDWTKRVFLTIGRQELSTFSHLENIWFLMRTIDPPAADTPIPKGQLLLERGPFSLADERKLLIKYQIEAIVSKNSGGDATSAKIIAARELGLPVVMVKRPSMPEGDRVFDVESALESITAHQP
ncbi:MAG: cobalt-precorrin-6A reductase [Xenococcaceae cyanobacterium]